MSRRYLWLCMFGMPAATRGLHASVSGCCFALFCAPFCDGGVLLVSETRCDWVCFQAVCLVAGERVRHFGAQFDVRPTNRDRSPPCTWFRMRSSGFPETCKVERAPVVHTHTHNRPTDQSDTHTHIHHLPLPKLLRYGSPTTIAYTLRAAASCSATTCT